MIFGPVVISGHLGEFGQSCVIWNIIGNILQIWVVFAIFDTSNKQFMHFYAMFKKLTKFLYVSRFW